MSDFEGKVLGMLGGSVQRLDSLEQRMDRMEQRMDAVVARLDAQDEAIDMIIQKLDRNATMVTEAMRSSEQALSTNIRISQRLARLENPEGDAA